MLFNVIIARQAKIKQIFEFINFYRWYNLVQTKCDKVKMDKSKFQNDHEVQYQSCF